MYELCYVKLGKMSLPVATAILITIDGYIIFTYKSNKYILIDFKSSIAPHPLYCKAGVWYVVY